MKGAILLRASGNDHPVAPKNGTDFSMAELYEHIRCDMVQIVRHPRDASVLLIMDEDGKLKHRPINQLVSSFFTQQVVVGDVIMCEKGFLK
jgi:hypothetical protein